MNIETISEMCKEACFYMDKDGSMFRIQYTNVDDGTFFILDEDTGEEYTIEFSDITFKGFESFYKISKMEVAEYESCLNNIDWALLQKQKECLLSMMGAHSTTISEIETLDGIINLLDFIQDEFQPGCDDGLVEKEQPIVIH